MALAGSGYRIHMTGLTHNKKGYPATFPDAHKKLMERLIAKIRDNADKIIEVEEKLLEDADIAVVVYGSEARPTWKAIQLAREKGIKVGMLKLITAWPFPSRKIDDLSQNVNKIIMPEVNYGQLIHMVREYSHCDVLSLTHPGGEIHSPDKIFKKIMEVGK